MNRVFGSKWFKNSIVLFVSLAGLVLSSVNVMGQGRILKLMKGESLKLHTDLIAAAYQWYKDGRAIESAGGPVLIVNEPGHFTVRAFNSDSCPSALSDPVDVQLVEDTIDLAITKHAEMKQVSIGDSFDYLLMVENKGPSVAKDVWITDTIPTGIEFAEMTNVSMGDVVYNRSNRLLSCRIANMGSGDKTELAFSVKALVPGTITNVAEVTGKGFDLHPENNRSTVSKKVLPLNIPNIFTPNGDGLNDNFTIPGISNFPDNYISIFNRWGNMVYQKDGYQNEWTGEGLSDGTYFYFLKIKVKEGLWDQYNGYITLRRSGK